MNIESKNIPGQAGVIIKLVGDHLDVSNSNTLKTQVEKLLADNSLVIMDLSSVSFIDSSGLGALLSFLRKMNAKQANFKLTGLSKPVTALFELVRIHKIFSIYNNVEEAVAAAQYDNPTT